MSDPQDIAIPESPASVTSGIRHTAKDTSDGPADKVVEIEESIEGGPAEEDTTKSKNTPKRYNTGKLSGIEDILKEDDGDDVFGQIEVGQEEKAEEEEATADELEVEKKPAVEKRDTDKPVQQELSQKEPEAAKPVSALFGDDHQEEDDPFAQVAQFDDKISHPTSSFSEERLKGIHSDDKAAEVAPIRVEDTFEGEEEADDPFGEIAQEDQPTKSDSGEEAGRNAPNGETKATRIEEIFADDGQAEDPFGGISQEKPDGEQSDQAEPILEPEPTKGPTRIHDIFAEADSADDPFGQIQQEDDQHEHDIPEEKPIEEVPTRINQIFGEEEDLTDAFADLAIEKEEPAQQAPRAESSVPLTAAQTAAEKDFSDLLAEFEDDLDVGPAADEAEVPAAQDQKPEIASAAGLFADDDFDSVFDEFAQQKQASASMSTEEPAASPENGGESVEGGKANDGNEPIAFEIPQGWYDDDGTWNWYTEEQKELVRQTMMGHGEWDQPEEPAVKAQSEI